MKIEDCKRETEVQDPTYSFCWFTFSSGVPSHFKADNGRNMYICATQWNVEAHVSSNLLARAGAMARG